MYCFKPAEKDNYLIPCCGWTETCLMFISFFWHIHIDGGGKKSERTNHGLGWKRIGEWKKRKESSAGQCSYFSSQVNLDEIYWRLLFKVHCFYLCLYIFIFIFIKPCLLKWRIIKIYSMCFSLKIRDSGIIAPFLDKYQTLPKIQCSSATVIGIIKPKQT
ncbi:hypothetical protein GGS20DRAFT_46550 [Poronia punctata]|nr:hypothetical protein GGS20DRAFT_46550 [Poronia punctata]